MTILPSKTDYLAYLHGFRGFAILCIIAAHSWSMLSLENDSIVRIPNEIWVYATTEAIFHGSTLFFALISGILFTRVLRNKPWTSFFKNKLINVIMPYLVASLIFTALSWPEILKEAAANGIHYFFPEVLFKNIVTGQAQIPFWYMPVLTVLFLLTPLLNWMLKFRNGILILALALMPLVMTRTTYPDLLSLKTMFFFLGAYGFGMYLGERQESMLAFTQRHLAMLWILFVISTTANFLLFFWEYAPTGFTSLHQSVVYVQKMLMALLLLYALYKYQARLPNMLNVLGTYAFSLYFLHFSFIWALSEVFVKQFPDTGILGLFTAGLLIYVLSIALCLLLSIGLRKLLGKYSRMLIGT